MQKNIFKSKFTGEQIEAILEKANNITDITPNPTEEATEELQKITIGDTIFYIPKSIIVEANPSEDATEELTKLKVGDTVFSIPQQSGNGGENIYKHIFNCDLISGSTKLYGDLVFINNNPTAYNGWSDVDYNTFVVCNGNVNGLPIFHVQMSSDGKLWCRYYTNNSNTTYGTFTFDLWYNDKVYNMSGELIDSSASGI